MKTELKCYDVKINKNFPCKKPFKDKYLFFFFKGVVLDFLGRAENMNEKYYEQVYLEDCKNEEKKAK